MDRVTRVVDRNGIATLYEYDANGNRTAVTYGNGIVVKYVYNDVNQLISEQVIDKDLNIIEEYIYTLGKAGERLAVTENDQRTEYEYDELYRLVSEKVIKSDGSVSKYSYTYDKVGNRLTKTVDGVLTEYTYNSLNQLVTETVKDSDIADEKSVEDTETGVTLQTTYAYDANGNLIFKKKADKQTTYTYDVEGRLVRATISAGQDVTVEEYKYDYAGNRIAKITEDETINYVVDTNGMLSQVLYETDSEGNVLAYYTRGIELLTLERGNKDYYYMYDGHGNVRHLTDETGSVTDTYDYDAFGNLVSKTGETENAYLYCGEQYDVNTGFYYLRARYMNPDTGTFISMDSYQGSLFDPVSLHKYLYANANPIMNSDPTGYFTLSELAITQKINAILQNVNTAKFILILNKANAVATIYDTVMQVLEVLNDPEASALDIAAAIGRGMVTGYFINKMCGIKLLGSVIKVITIAVGIASQVDSIFEAVDEGRWDLVIARSVQLFAQVVSLGQSCFTGDTLVSTREGQKPIEEVEVGDEVWSYNVETGEAKLNKVAKVYVHKTDTIVHLHIESAIIDTTTTHPFYVVGKGFVAAADIQKGNKIYALDGSLVEVKDVEIEKLEEEISVYNLEVEENHTYFVGEEAVLVHNSCGGSDNDGTSDVGSEGGSKPSKIQFPENPDDFNPEGLRKIGPFGTKNGKIIKWLDENNKAVYEWDEDLTYGSHYHVIGEDGNTRLPNSAGETHFFPGDIFEE